MTKKEIVKNRKGQKIVVLVEKLNNQKGLVFVMHGLGGFKEQPHIEAMADAFKESGCTTVRFDTTNTLGESDGAPELATITSFYEDLEDVIEWASKQEWYEEPFFLAGHSIGGMSVVTFAQKHPEKVKALAPISTVVSGVLLKSTYTPGTLESWEQEGILIEHSTSKPGVLKKTGWNFIVDGQRHDALVRARKLIMPVLLIVGEIDSATTPEHQKIFFEALPGPKELHIIKEAKHTFRDPEHLQELKQLIANWLRKNQ